MSYKILLSISMIFALLSFLSLTQSGSRYQRVLVALAAGLYASYQLIFILSHEFTGAGIDESVIYHLRYGLQGAGFDEYRELLLLSLATVTALCVLAVLLIPVCQKVPLPWRMNRRGVFPVLAISAIASSPATLDIIHLLPPQSERMGNSSENASFNQHYLSPQVSSVSDTPRHLVLVSLESIEATFLDEEAFPGLTPGLNKLVQGAINFSEIREITHTDWTIAGVVASHCGIPLLSPSGGNAMGGMDSFLPGAVCLGDYLSNAGYTLEALSGSSMRFAGTGKFLETHGVTNVSGFEELEPQLRRSDYKTPWGLYDDNLYEIAFERIAKHITQGSHLGLFIFTMDTHPPGYLSEDCRGQKYGDGSNSQLNAISCADMLISRFVERIRSSEFGSNTVVVISSDHLIKGRNNPVSLDESARNNLFLIITPNNDAAEITETGSKLDIASTLLPHLGFRGEIGLGRDLMKGPSLLTTLPDFESQLIAWRDNIIKLWQFPELSRTDRLTVSSETRRLTLNNRSFDVPVLISVGPEGNSRFHFRSSYLHQPEQHRELRNHLVSLPPDTPFLWIDECREMRPSILRNETDFRLCSMTGRTERTVRLQELRPEQTIPATDFFEPTLGIPLIDTSELAAYARDVDRFIAHAGGQIDESTYSNSLEALNESYRRGFRYFELDIIRTVDGSFVAAHDWSHWQSITGYDGPLPPDKANFLKTAIYGRFTPLDMDRINEWFNEREDAFLITDKVNRPREFSREFIDPSRLTMELFTVDAVEQATQLGITAMPTGRLIGRELTLEELQKLGVTRVAASREDLERRLPLFWELKQSGIKVFLFHVNRQPGKDERHVICRDLPFAHGLYADHYNFDDPATCG